MSEHEIVSYIKVRYPQLYNASNKLFRFDKKVDSLIQQKYGDGYEYITKLNDYYEAIGDISTGKPSTTKMHNLARRRQPLYDNYSDESYKMAIVEGYDKSFMYLDMLEKHIKATS